MAHYILNLRPFLCFELAPNMQIACIEVCIYVISKSVYDRPGRFNKKKSESGHGIPRASHETLYTVYRRSYGLYGRTAFKAVRQYIKGPYSNTFQSLLIPWTSKGHNILIYYSIFNFSQVLSSVDMIYSNRLIIYLTYLI